MKLKIFLTIFFALALFAGVFFEISDEAQAASIEPWNVTAEVICGDRKETYSLKNIVSGEKWTESEKQNRGYFLGESGKRKLYAELCAMKLPKDAIYNYILPDFSTLVHKFDYTYVQKRDATVTFTKNGFHYNDGVNGVSIDKYKLFDELLKSNGRKITVRLPLKYEKAVTVAELKQKTVKKGCFTTYFTSSGANRSYNIARAAESLDGITVAAGETFSFNDMVGKRTEQNGYKSAKVILDGNYTDGIGGGVCQVSTTLYNALLLSEIVPHACQHSLISHYVMAGFDAMVSDGGADLTFTNNFSYPVYISAKVNKKQKSITFCVYGEPNLCTIKRECDEIRTPYSTVEIVDREKYPELLYADQTKVIVHGSDGVKTKSYLCFYRDGKLVERRLIRQNTYKKVDMLVARGYMECSDSEKE